MKRFGFLALASVMAFGFAAQAQAQSAESSYRMTTYPKADARVIPTVGLASMTLKTDTTSGSNDQGVSAGALFDIGSGSYSFQTGLLYNQFGGRSKYNDLTVTLNYISIPAVFKVNFSGNPESTFFVKSGVMPSFLKSAKATQEVDGVTRSKSDTTGLNKFDLPLVVGAGGAIPISLSNSLILDVSYIRGSTKVAKENEQKIRNEGFMFTGGISFDL